MAPRTFVFPVQGVLGSKAWAWGEDRDFGVEDIALWVSDLELRIQGLERVT